MKRHPLDQRRRRLGLPFDQLVTRSGLPAEAVKRILTDPSHDSFGNVAAVARVLGIDMAAARRTPVATILRDRALAKARYVARLVQGSQGLEASGVDQAGFERLVEVSATTLLAGKKRKLWDDDA